MNGITLLWASAVGTALQLAMVSIGHQVTQVRDLFLWGGLILSAAAGALYAQVSSASLNLDFVAGILAGASCAFIGILVSYFLGDVPGRVLLFGTFGSAMAGGVGAALIHQVR